MSLFSFYISDLEEVMQLADRVGATVKDELSSENWLRLETMWFRAETISDRNEIHASSRCAIENTNKEKDLNEVI